MDKLYENIKARRKSMGMTQSELAKKMGYIDRSSIAKIENGIVDIPQSKIIQFAKVLETTPSELMGETGYILRDTSSANVQPEGQVSWYDDPVMQQVADRLKNNSDYRMLFEAASNIRPEDISFVTEFIKRMGGDV